MYVHLEIGQSPVILTVPHDGGTKIPGAALRRGFGARDLGTLELARTCRDELRKRKINPTLLWFGLHRSHADVNRSPDHEPFADGFKQVYEEFHHALTSQIEMTTRHASGCLLIDFHGYVRSPGPEQYDVVIGSNRHKTSPRESDRKIAANLDTHYRTVFSPDPTQGVSGIYRGGWVVRSAAAQWADKGLDAVQLEFNRHLRHPQITASLAAHLAMAIKESIG